ncbi:hypothetical protein Tco_1328893 [Tanacetum coccineum]
MATTSLPFPLQFHISTPVSNFAPWAVFGLSSSYSVSFQGIDGMGSIRIVGLNMGVPPCKSISLQGTRSKFDLVCYCTVSYAVNRFHLFKPQVSPTTPLSALELRGWQIKEVRVGAFRATYTGPSDTRVLSNG